MRKFKRKIYLSNIVNPIAKEIPYRLYHRACGGMLDFEEAQRRVDPNVYSDPFPICNKCDQPVDPSIKENVV